MVVPLDVRDPRTCRVTFDWFLEREAAAAAGWAPRPGEPCGSTPHASSAWASGLPPFVAAGLADSHAVQQEDIALCEAVQAGLEDPAYGAGRYAPALEAPMWSFHRQLHALAG